MVVEMRDEQALSVQPEGMVGYARNQVGGTPEGRPLGFPAFASPLPSCEGAGDPFHS